MAPPVHWLVERLPAHGEKVFLHRGADHWTYAQLAAAVDRAGRELEALPLGPGATAAVAGDYSFAAIATFLALVARRAVIVPLATPVESERRRRCDIAGVGWIYDATAGTWTRHDTGPAPSHPLLAGLGAAGHAGLVLFSSGSSGEPKAMVHDLDRLLESHRERRARSLTLLIFLLFDHIGGLNTLFTALATGATIVVPEAREPDAVCALVARHRVAVLPASPTFLNLILISGAAGRHDLSSLRIVTYGTEPMPEALLARLRAALPGVKFLQTFGTSETGIAATTSKSSDSTLLKIEDDSLEHRVVDGELWLRSRTQILGYLNHSMQAFTDDGWFRTGDLVETAADGYLRIVGRRSEVINVGGEKVLPAEVESVLLTLPGIADCVVFGEASAIAGQVVCAEVILASGTDPATIRQVVRRHCRERLAPYKIPVKVEVVEHARLSDRFKRLRRFAP